jgi:hypothetical protein
MKFLLLSMLLIVGAWSCNTLEKNIQTIELEYIPWSCDCANWATLKDIQRFSGREDQLAEHCIFIEPENPNLTLPDSIGYIDDRVIFTGQFYDHKGFPKNFQSEEPVDKSRVFRYTKFQIVNSSYRETLEY